MSECLFRSRFKEHVSNSETFEMPWYLIYAFWRPRQALEYAWRPCEIKLTGRLSVISRSADVNPEVIMLRDIHFLLIVFAGISLLLAGCILPAASSGSTDPETEVGNPYDVVEQSLENQAPQANAGEDQTATSGQSVQLDGTGSSDLDGDALSFTWSQIAGSPTVTLEQPFSAIVHFQAPTELSTATTLTFRLTVSDGFDASVDQVTVTIEPGD